MVQPKTLNYLRLVYLIVEIGTTVLKDAFLRFVQSTFAVRNIDAYLKVYESDIRCLRKQSVITAAQFKMLFPKNRQTEIDEWDISLLCFVLVHCCTLEGKRNKLMGFLLPGIQVNHRNKCSTVDTFLQTNKGEIETLLKNHLVTQEQFMFLYPVKGPVSDIRYWGIELVTCLAIHLCKDQSNGHLKDIVEREIQLYHTNLSDFLSINKCKLDRLRVSRNLTDADYNHFFPENGADSNISEWGNTALKCIVLKVCKTLSVDAIESIRDMRNTLLHEKKAEVDDNMYLDSSTQFKKCVYELMEYEDNTGSVQNAGSVINAKMDDILKNPLLDTATIKSLRHLWFEGHLGENDEIRELLDVLKQGLTQIQNSVIETKKDLENCVKRSEEVVTREVRTSEERITDIVNSSVSDLKGQLHLQSKEIKDIKDSLSDVKELKERLEQVAKNLHRNCPCVSTVMTEIEVSSEDQRSTILAENIIILETNASIQDQPTLSGDEDIREGIESWRTTLQNNDIDIIKTVQQCILVLLKCSSIKGLTNLLELYLNGELQQHLDALACILEKKIKARVILHMKMTVKDFHDALDNIENQLAKANNSLEGESKVTSKVLLKCNSVRGLSSLWRMFSTGEATKSLDKVSEAVSKHIGVDVTLSASLNLDSFKDALTVAENALYDAQNRSSTNASLSEAKENQEQQSDASRIGPSFTITDIHPVASNEDDMIVFTKEEVEMDVCVAERTGISENAINDAQNRSSENASLSKAKENQKQQSDSSRIGPSATINDIHPVASNEDDKIVNAKENDEMDVCVAEQTRISENAINDAKNRSSENASLSKAKENQKQQSDSSRIGPSATITDIHPVASNEDDKILNAKENDEMDVAEQRGISENAINDAKNRSSENASLSKAKENQKQQSDSSRIGPSATITDIHPVASNEDDKIVNAKENDEMDVCVAEQRENAINDAQNRSSTNASLSKAKENQKQQSDSSRIGPSATINDIHLVTSNEDDIIVNAEEKDEMNVCVAEQTEPDKSCNLQQTVQDPLLANWVKAGLALKMTRNGIENYVDSENHKLQQTVMADICRVKALPAGTVCKTCTTHNVLPCTTRGICHQNRGVCKYHDPGDPAKQHKPCPTGICDEIYQRIITSHRYHGPSWKNTNALDWCSNPWEWAKCYMAADGYNSVTSAKETDFPGLISVIINNTEFQKTVTENLSLPNNTFCEARKIRNKILHTSSFQVSNAELTNYVDKLILLLSDPKYLASDTNAQDAIAKLNQIKTGFLNVTTQDEAKLRAEALQAISETKQEAIDEVEQVIREKVQHIDVKTHESIKALQGEGGKQAANIDKKKHEVEQAIQEKVQHIDVKTQESINAIQGEGGKQAAQIDKTKHEVEQVIQEKVQHIDVKTQESINAIQGEGGRQAAHIDNKKHEVEQVIQEKVQHIDVKTQESINAIQGEGGKQAAHIDNKKHEVEQVIREKVQHIDVKTQESINAIQGEGGKQAAHIDNKKHEVEQVIQEKVQHIDVKTRDAINTIQYEGEKQAGQIGERAQEKIKEIKAVQAVRKKVKAKSKKNYMEEKKELQAHLIRQYERMATKAPENDLLPELIDLNDIYVKPCLKKLNLEQTKLNTIQSDSLQQSNRDEAKYIPLNTYNDIFYNRSHPCRNIYISGDAGIGKSAFCQEMISIWYMSRIRYRQSSVFHRLMSKFGKQKSENEDSMLKFEYLFYIPLRHAISYGNIEEMISNMLLQNESHVEVLSTILQKESEKCLIILDGLDEWSPPKHYQPSPLVTEGLPVRMINNCTIVTTTRPWKLEVLRLRSSEMDQQITMSGLDRESSDKLMHLMFKCLNTKYRQNKNPEQFQWELKKKKNLTEFMTVHVLLKQLICLWYDNKPLGESQCTTYSGMINLLFELAEPKLATNEYIRKLKEAWAESDIQLPKCFNEKTACQQFRPLLHSLGHLAFKTLFNVEPAYSLVFDSSVAEMYGLSSTDIDICLKVGILTQSKVTLVCTSRMKSLSFVHKTFQEFLAAMFVSLKSEEFDANIKEIYSICNSVEKVLEMSKMFVFVSGINPEAAQRLCKHIHYVTSQDPLSVEYIQSVYEPELWFNFRAVDPVGAAEKALTRIQDTILDCVKESSDNGYEPIRPQLEHVFIKDKVMSKHQERLICLNMNISSIHMKGSLPREVEEHVMYADCLKKMTIKEVDFDKFSTLVSKCKSTLTTIELLGSLNSVIRLNLLEVFPTILYDVDHLSAISLIHIEVTHEQIECLMSYLSQATLMNKIGLYSIACSTHGDDCGYQLDLSRLHQLQHLSLYMLPVDGLIVHNTQLQYCHVSVLYRPGGGAESVLRCLQAAPKLHNLIIGGYNLDAALVVATLPSLVHLQDIVIWGVDFGKLDLKLSPDMMNLNLVRLSLVTMTTESCIGFIASIPYTQHPVRVELRYMYKASLKKVMHYINSCSRFHVVSPDSKSIEFYTV